MANNKGQNPAKSLGDEETSSPKSPRAKIDERLESAINDAPPTKNRSSELVPLTAEYEKMRKNCTFHTNVSLRLSLSLCFSPI
jgi:hypothetical protein